MALTAAAALLVGGRRVDFWAIPWLLLALLPALPLEDCELPPLVMGKAVSYSIEVGSFMWVVWSSAAILVCASLIAPASKQTLVYQSLTLY